MTFLLDVNVLIALIDPAHVGHDAAHRWFEAEGREGFATCPITENGVLRIVGHPNYPNGPGSPAGVVATVRSLRSLPGHVFWADDISLADTAHLDARQGAHAGPGDGHLPIWRWRLRRAASWPPWTAGCPPPPCAARRTLCA